MVNFWPIVNYVDPHHKRIEARPVSFCAKTEDSIRSILFIDQDEQNSITMRESGESLSATIAEEAEEFVLWKIQLLEQLNLLTLDFEDNPRLRRIVVHVENLSTDELDSSLKNLIGNRSILYYRHS